MDQLLNWLWDEQSSYGFVVLLSVISAIVLTLIYVRFQSALKQLVTDSPYPVLVLDASDGQLLISNEPAIQLLGIRSLGTRFLYPTSFNSEYLLALTNGFSSQYFRQQLFDWKLSETESIKIELFGRKSQLRGHCVWIVYAQPYQEIHQEQQEKEKLGIAYSEDGSLSEQSYLQERNRLFEVNQGDAGAQSGEIIRSLSIGYDVTEWDKIQQNLREEMERRKDTEVALAQRDTILHTILDASPDPIGIFNEDLVYQACNKPFVNALGISDVSELIGKRLQDVIPEELYRRLKESDIQVLHDAKPVRYIDKTFTTDGHYTWFDVVKSPFKDKASGTNGVLIMARDISERYLAEQKLEEANFELEKLSFLDGLTQVANRRRFDEQLHTLWYHHVREKKPLTIMLCDIDFFKDFNDSYGHQSGDEALIKVANVFKGVVNRSSDCVARYGGEEFAFILPNITVEGAERLSQRIHQQIQQAAIGHVNSDVAQKLTVSIGCVSCVPQCGDEPETGVAMADSALYQAKADGRNRTYIHPHSYNVL